jgi:Rod binding domain-containing protein
MDIPASPARIAPPTSVGVSRSQATDAATAAFEFEVVFLSQAVEEMMRATTAGEFGGGHAEQTWRSFLARAFAEEIAGHGGTGIARSIEAGIAAYGNGKRDR